jgi:hypothetical protein
LGSPQSSLDLKAGQILVDISENGIMNLTIVDPNWSGEELIEITVNDLGTLNNY